MAEIATAAEARPSVAEVASMLGVHEDAVWSHGASLAPAFDPGHIVTIDDLGNEAWQPQGVPASMLERLRAILS